MSRDPLSLPAWQPWIDDVCAALGVDPALVDVADLHALSGDVAASFTRPMAPVSTFLFGLAVGAGVNAETARQAIREAASQAG